MKAVCQAATVCGDGNSQRQFFWREEAEPYFNHSSRKNISTAPQKLLNPTSPNNMLSKN